MIVVKEHLIRVFWLDPEGIPSRYHKIWIYYGARYSGRWLDLIGFD